MGGDLCSDWYLSEVFRRDKALIGLYRKAGAGVLLLVDICVYIYMYIDR